jgi:DNA-directed RNA polymerase alpha subunit
MAEGEIRATSGEADFVESVCVPVLYRKIETVGLSTRAQNAVVDAGVSTVEELVELARRWKYLPVKNVGKETISEVWGILRRYGLLEAVDASVEKRLAEIEKNLAELRYRLRQVQAVLSGL